MSEEEKIVTENKEECKCFCKSEGFRNFLTIALGTFVGFYAALSLFAALHKPPMMCPHRCGQMFGGHPHMAAPCPFKHGHHHFNKGHREQRPDMGNFDEQQNPAPFEKRNNAN